LLPGTSAARAVRPPPPLPPLLLHHRKLSTKGQASCRS
jgi:hypothetical protein